MVTLAMVHSVTFNDPINTPIPTDDDGASCDGVDDDDTGSSAESEGRDHSSSHGKHPASARPAGGGGVTKKHKNV
jgi:hypothetical protein